ncbi:MAG TPA: FtsX-like permease family protein, partial [Candidatus Izemoplasmatales bacterium]|nr:FtsX-like permease family protein [Candidatus Izemoplasmatales bacterium]
ISFSNDLGYAPENRILVNKADGKPFSDNEMASLRNNSRIKQLVTFDFLLDQYRSIQGEIGPSDKPTIEFYDPLFMPVSMFGDQYESMPEDGAVVVLSEYIFKDDDRDLTGEPIRMTSYLSDLIDDYELAVHDQYHHEDVGDVIDGKQRTFIFVHDLVWHQLAKDFGYMNEVTYLIQDASTGVRLNEEVRQAQIKLNTNLDADEINVSAEKFGLVNSSSRQVDVLVNALYKEADYDSITMNGVAMDTGNIEVGQEMYDQFFNPDEIYQISLFANDGIDAINFVDEVDNNIYQIFHPASAGASEQFEGLIFMIMNFGMLILFGVLFTGVFFVSYLIIKNIINSKLNDYAIFRTIGANKSTIRNFIYLETLFVAAFAFFIFTLFVAIAIPFIKENGMLYVLKFYNFKNFVYLFIFMAVYSLLLSRRYVSRVYHDTVAETLRREME